jgi:uncharacterized protein (DUF952 family)
MDAESWLVFQRTFTFDGSPADLADGFIHFSDAQTVAETAAKHFAGQRELMLVAVSAETLGEALRWEKSRGGRLFPHLYSSLPLSAVQWARPLPLGEDGRHLFPADLP